MLSEQICKTIGAQAARRTFTEVAPREEQCNKGKHQAQGTKNEQLAMRATCLIDLDEFGTIRIPRCISSEI